MAEAATEWARILWERTKTSPAPVPFYVGRLIDAVQHHHTGPDADRAFVAVASANAFFRPAARAPIDRATLEALWLGTNCPGSSDHLAVLRLLRKGLPAPTSIRYIGEQLRRASTIPTVAEMIRRFALGDHHGAWFVAPLDVRARLNRTDVSELAGHIAGLFTNRDVFYIVAEFLISETVDHGALLHALNPTMRWSVYVDTIQAATNNRLRPRFIERCRAVWAAESAPPGAASPSAPSDDPGPAADLKPTSTRCALVRDACLPARTTIGLLSKLLRIRPGQMPRYVSQPPAASDNPDRSEWVAAAVADFMRPILGGGLDTSLLRRHGMSAAAHDRIVAAQRNSRMLTAAVRGLSPNDRYVLGLAVAATLHRDTSTTLVTHFWRPGVARSTAIVCDTCMSLCSRFRGDARLGTGQIDVCLAGMTVRCTVCQGGRLRIVRSDRVSFRVGGRMVSVCDDCGKLSACPTSIGAGIVCEGCMAKRRTAQAVASCFCGHYGDGVRPFAAMDGPVLRMFGACPRHASAVPQTTIVDIRAITARCHRGRHYYKPD